MSDHQYEPGIISVGVDPDARFISIGVVTEEQAKSEEQVLPPAVALYDVPRLSQLLLTLHSHLNGMIAAVTRPIEEEDAPSIGR